MKESFDKAQEVVYMQPIGVEDKDLQVGRVFALPILGGLTFEFEYPTGTGFAPYQ
jgi:hypothetical protein